MTRPARTTVVAYLALFLALGAGTAFAATQLAKNSVGPKQLKKNSVTGPKIKKDAITGAKVKDASLLGADLADGTINGIKFAPGSLTQSDLSGVLRADNVIGVSLDKNCGPAAPFPAGVSAKQVSSGCDLEFGSSVLNCATTANVNFRFKGLLELHRRSVQVFRTPEDPNELRVFSFNDEELIAQPTDLLLVC